MKLQALAESHL